LPGSAKEQSKDEKKTYAKDHDNGSRLKLNVIACKIALGNEVAKESTN